MKHLYKALTVLLASLMVLTTGCGVKSADYAKTVAATVNNESIYLDEAAFWLYLMQSSEFSYYSYLYSMYGMSLDEATFWQQSSGNRTQTQEQYLKEEVMAELLQSRIINSHLSEYPDAALTDADKAKIAEYVKTLKSQYKDEFWNDIGSPSDERIAEYLSVRSQAVKIWDAARRNLSVEVADEDCESFTVEYFAITLSVASQTVDTSTEASSEAAEPDPKTLKGQALADAVEADLKAGKTMKEIAEYYTNATKQTASYARKSTSTAVPFTAGKELKTGEYKVDKNDTTIYVVYCTNDADEEATAEKRTELTLSAQATAFDEKVCAEWNKAAKYSVAGAYDDLKLR